MAIFEFKNAQELGRVCQRHGVKYLFFGKSGAILLGFSDTTQDVDLYVEKQAANCGKLVDALGELGFRLTGEEQQENRGFDLDPMVSNGLTMRGNGAAEGGASRLQAANRQKDKESLPRLLSFREWLQKNQ
jgi:hypothetical protein